LVFEIKPYAVAILFERVFQCINGISFTLSCDLRTFEKLFQ
jgi:hypothetical protein